MTGERSIGLMLATLLLASFLSVATAQTATLHMYDAGVPASCTSLATLLSKYPPPTDGEAVDDALNDGINAFLTQYEATATATASLDRTSFCDFIISTQIPSATPSVTSALSSYVSAAGIWLEDHGLDNAKSLLEGDCGSVVQTELAIGALDFVVAFGQCYELLDWNQKTSAAGSGATATMTTDASSAPTATSTVTSSGSGSVHATPSPPSAGSRTVVGALWVLGTTVSIILLLC
ncbi:hypothetical protein F4801DRAFT_565847 [Xylaria longipes]|nr:hypothetical protein F4801DRAFT_565847 [Xylaria longipes]